MTKSKRLHFLYGLENSVTLILTVLRNYRYFNFLNNATIFEDQIATLDSKSDALRKLLIKMDPNHPIFLNNILLSCQSSSEDVQEYRIGER